MLDWLNLLFNLVTNSVIDIYIYIYILEIKLSYLKFKNLSFEHVGNLNKSVFKFLEF